MLYFFTMDLYQIWFRDPLTNVINSAKFYCNQFSSFDLVDQNSPFQLTWAVGINKVLTL